MNSFLKDFPDTPMGQLLAKLWNLLVLNLLWILTSLPLLTLGAATSAAYATAIKLRRGECNTIVAPYFRHFVQNLLQASLLWLLTAAAGFSCVWQLLYGLQAGGLQGLALTVAGLTLGILLLLVSGFAWPLTARYHQPFLQLLLNSLGLARLHVGKLLCICLLWVLPIALTLLFPMVVLRFFGWLWLVPGMGGIIYACAGIADTVFSRLAPPQGEEPKDTPADS